MELNTYQECVELMQFYEVYCAKSGGVVGGSVFGVGVMVLSAIALLWAVKLIDKTIKKF